MNNSHLAAHRRKHLSVTARLMLNQDLLSRDETHLDYGCGKGDDVRHLQSLGYQSCGYDPYYFPTVPQPADVVTIAYVLNVIQDLEERREALLKSWSLARKCLIVAADVRGKGVQETDAGRISSYGVYWKTYSHLELKAWIETVLGGRAQKLAKDKFLICKDTPAVTVRSRSEVLQLSETLHREGFIAPFHCVIRGYCTGFQVNAGMIDTRAIQNYGRWAGSQRYYRLKSTHYNLPGAKGQQVKVVHLGYFGSEKFEWAIAAVRRRNILARA